MNRVAVAVATALVLVATACGSDRGADVGLPGPVRPGYVYPAPPQGTRIAPDFTLNLIDGPTIKASELWKDRPMVVVFFSSWCKECAEQQDIITELASRYRDVVVFVGVAGTRDNEKAVKDYRNQHHIDYMLGLDNGRKSIGQTYGLTDPPLVSLMAKGGGLVRGRPTAANLEQDMNAVVIPQSGQK
ncbi:TlpA family protein disulfide reductase [Pseudonocardiaceae bacterium YIM PH 21723]|nr:TlpA family protein disulfide reductase [Pseudonocardiaceae bacterium YIM PH 21723]